MAGLLPFSLAGGAFAVAAQPVLRVHGAVGPGPGPGDLAFDGAALDALPQTRFRTTTLWHQAPAEFSGISARDLFAAVRLRSPRLRLVALNDYVVEADADEIVAADGLFATRQDGVLMPVSDKGPIFLLFPFDQREELRHQTYYSRAVWQLCEIEAVS
jgi:hypothetical protein